ncbi:MAG: hypothetical protein JSV05_06260 [Candidatus Bathyarchaeota archaeon]|nr:MAG: hypothetical protein JSV05_06260 [Candidatus Bathyarchaeota archaeon]
MKSSKSSQGFGKRLKELKKVSARIEAKMVKLEKMHAACMHAWLSRDIVKKALQDGLDPAYQLPK